MKIFIASAIWVVIGSLVCSFAMDQPEPVPPHEGDAVQAQCPRNCQGDFPVSSNRKYAEARDSHQWS
jgi:hypothetical protein